MWGKLHESKNGCSRSNASSTKGILGIPPKPSPNDQAPGTAHSDIYEKLRYSINNDGKKREKVFSTGEWGGDE